VVHHRKTIVGERLILHRDFLKGRPALALVF
jgi:hypothetical protein